MTEKKKKKENIKKNKIKKNTKKNHFHFFKETTMQKVKFDQKILFLGMGAVARSVVPLFKQFVEYDPSKVLVVDAQDIQETIKKEMEEGWKFLQYEVTSKNFGEFLKEHLQKGDFLIDLSVSFRSALVVDWCQENRVLYVNASMQMNPDDWATIPDRLSNQQEIKVTEKHKKELYRSSIYIRQRMLEDIQVKEEERKKARGPDEQNSMTAIVDHGANPGLVSHFTKRALVDIVKHMREKKIRDEKELDKLESLVKEKNFPELARQLGVKVIHISERDTQITNEPKKVGEFVNTWSVDGLWDEGVVCAELGWGTHEKTIPKFGLEFDFGPKNAILLLKKAINTHVHSWVPKYNKIVGVLIPHAEAVSISHHLTVRDENNKPIYRPTVHYAYCLCDMAWASIHELKMRNYELQEKQRIMFSSILDGDDTLGVLLMGNFGAWWTGCVLTIHETRRLLPDTKNVNSTTLQVAIAIISAVVWAIKNPHKGVNFPDDIPYDEILDLSIPFLGEFLSVPANDKFHPVFHKAKDRQKPFPKEIDFNDDQTWQLENFLTDY
eukprot:Anaeramoba_ignava/c21842_g2_i1.p1 GENE.c21842_g2_i1~~c21842_g2_i1.p1  ORF type:complete len:552 (+),score=160.79 c21842_g2_i1:374-2029(+)